MQSQAQIRMKKLSAFGSNMSTRVIGGYRYGYQGSEKDSEIAPDIETTFFRELDGRICKWWSVDPKATAWESPYVMMGNNPISYNDQLGDSLPLIGKSTNGLNDLRKMVSPINAWRLTTTQVNNRSYLNVLNVNLGANADGTQVAYVPGTDAALDLLNLISIDPTIHIAYEVTNSPLVNLKTSRGNPPPFTPPFFNNPVSTNCELPGLLIAANSVLGIPSSQNDLCKIGYAPPNTASYGWYIARHPNVQFYADNNHITKLDLTSVMYEQIFAAWTKINSTTFLTLQQARNIAEDKATTDPNYKGVSGVKKGTNRLITSTL